VPRETAGQKRRTQKNDRGNQYRANKQGQTVAASANAQEHGTAQMSADRKPMVSWAAVLDVADQKPGFIHEAYSRFHNYSLGNQLLALFQCMRGIQPGPLATPRLFNRTATGFCQDNPPFVRDRWGAAAKAAFRFPFRKLVRKGYNPDQNRKAGNEDFVGVSWSEVVRFAGYTGFGTKRSAVQIWAPRPSFSMARFSDAGAGRAFVTCFVT